MANKYVDHGLYPAYSATPTWGNAEDGDGTSTSTATPSTASIVFTGVPSSGSIFVLGVAVSPTWATDADTCANNLATSINALTTTAVGPASFTTKSQVRNHLYARGPANGAAAGTCEIQTRQASASHAGLVAFTHTLNNVSSAATVNFSGGSGGAWGYLYNTGTVWKSAVAIGAYGAIVAPVWTGAIDPGDCVNLRADKDVSSTSTIVLFSNQLGTEAAPVSFLVDNNTIWADGPNKIIALRLTGSSGTAIRVEPHANSVLHIKGQRTADGTRNLKLANEGTNVNNGISLVYNSNSIYECIDVLATSIGSVRIFQGVNNARTKVMDCRLQMSANADFVRQWSGYAAMCEVIACEFSNLGNASANVGAIMGGINNTCGLVIESPVFTDFVVGSKLYQTNGSNNNKIQITSPRLGNITKMTDGAILNRSNNNKHEYVGSEWLSISSQLDAHDFYIETNRGLVEANSGRAFPYLNATLPSGTGYSVRMLTSTQAGNIGRAYPLISPRFAKKYTLSAAQRTITARFAIEQSLTWTKRDIEILVVYSTNSGQLQYMSSFDALGGALSTDASTWSSQSNGSDGGTAGQVKFDDSGLLFFDKYKIELTTPTGKNIDANSELSLYVRLSASVGSLTKYMFFDPEFGIT